MALKRPSVDKNLTKKSEADTELAAAAQQLHDDSEDDAPEVSDDTLPYAAPAAEPATRPDVPNAAGQLPTLSSKTQVPVVTTGNHSGGAMTMQQTQDDDDFDDLDSEVGFGSFDIMKLDKKEFVCGSHTFPEFQGVLHQGRKKFLFKADDDHLCYSYDGAIATDGRTVEDHFAEWREEGVLGANESPQRSRYFEIGTEVVNTGSELDGDMVLCSIPPASVSRLAGYKQKLKIRGLKLNQVVTLITTGAKVTLNGGKITFYPWDFKLVGRVG